MSSSRHSIRSSHEPWLYRHFQHKDKLRVQERYWHPLPPKLPFFGNCNYVVIPDGPSWRRYLRLLMHLIEEGDEEEEQPLESEANSHLLWVLLESAVELLDWRNLSPSIERPVGANGNETFRVRESAAPRERTKLLKLLEHQTRKTAVRPFCDLSFREPEFDEWEFLRYSSMSIAERSRHALVRAARMIHGQAQPNQQVIVIVDGEEERNNLQSQAGDELVVVDMDGFLCLMTQQNLLAHPKKLDKLTELKCHCEEDYWRRNETPIDGENLNDSTGVGVHEYISEEEVQKGLKNGSFVRGRLEVTKENPKEGFVTTGDMRYFVNQREEHFNRAFHGDVVILKKLPKSEWGRPIGRRKLVHKIDDDADDPFADEDIPAEPSGRVVAIAAASSRSEYVATLVDVPLQDENAILLVPMDIRIPKIRVTTKSWQKYTNQRLLVEIDGWQIGSAYPHGRCSEVIGPIGELEVEIKCLLIENQVLLDPFSAAATACLPPEGAKWTVPNEEVKHRRDLRKIRRVFSVDPPGCQDIDDSMHAQVLQNGDIEVGVHIADVTFFVPHRSPLDKEAQKRGTTFYLVDRRFDMLPSLLSSDLCSLHGSVDRLAVSVIWTLAPNLETVKDVWYGRTVIHNCQAMTYDQAHNILHDKPPDDPQKPEPPPLTAGYNVDPKQIPDLKKDLTILRDLGRNLKKRREEVGGAVDLSSGDMGGGELKFNLDENGNPTAVKPKKELEIHNTIAEMMIFANGYVATKIFESFPDSALLRIHRTVEHARFQDLKDVLDVGGVSLEGSSNMALANTLKQVEKADAVVNSLIKSLATRAMSEAQYISTGDRKDGLELSHYGLGVDYYTHFTSPIRRYADCIVHKQLLAALFKDELVENRETDVIPTAFKHPERTALTSIPDSNVISIMGGEGLEPGIDASNNEGGEDDDDLDDLLDSLIEGASEMALGADHGKSGDADAEEENGAVDAVGEKNVDSLDDPHNPSIGVTTKARHRDQRLQPYDGTEVSRIADNLNRQNRMAKLSSMECQKLFLSLYFRDHVETARGVVTNLRANGFFVYIPEYDISGPIYVQDTKGDVQIDPSFLGLPPTAGQPPTLGFAASDTCRRFPAGICTLVEAPDGSPGGTKLEVSVPEGKKTFTVRTVDVVTVSLRCDDWDVRSRVPTPRFQLASAGSRPPPGFGEVTKSKKITSEVLQEQGQDTAREHADDADNSSKRPNAKDFSSLFDVLQANEALQPVLNDVPIRSYKNRTKPADGIDRQEEFKGRIVYGNFVNPDTKSATQEAAISAASKAAAQRRANAIETDRRRNEFDSARNIERNVMARTQRLAAEKRNTRQKKSGR